MQLFFTDRRKVWKAGSVAGLAEAELATLFDRVRLAAGVSRATMNRATTVLAEWNQRAAQSPASLHDQRGSCQVK